MNEILRKKYLKNYVKAFRFQKNHVKSWRNVLFAVNEFPKNNPPKSHVKTWRIHKM